MSRKYHLVQIVLALLLALMSLINRASALSQAPNRIVVYIPSRTLVVYSGHKMLRRFPVGVGEHHTPTPVGHFRVLDKVANPGWENPYLQPKQVRIHPGHKSPLGSRWIGFQRNLHGEYGIHGTNVPTSVGKFSTHGCIRMRNQDAEVLYSIVRVGTPVDVTNKPCTGCASVF
jgi:L,D-transpeptidase ErfK/SrfK